MDENINGTYCQICKRRVAMPEALFGSTFVCDKCVCELGAPPRMTEFELAETMKEIKLDDDFGKENI